MNRLHHAFVIEAGAEEGIALARTWVERELGLTGSSNPDILELRFGLFSVADARRVADLAAQAPIAHDSNAIIIAASRAYHEAQNALLKLFEEPPPQTVLFLILPSLGGLLPTLRSRVQLLTVNDKSAEAVPPEAAEEFLKSGREKRTAIIKKLTSGRDEEDRREKRDEAILIMNGVEAILARDGVKKHAAVLEDIAVLRRHLYDRSAPIKMILEHLSLILPERSRLV